MIVETRYKRTGGAASNEVPRRRERADDIEPRGAACRDRCAP